MTDKNKSASESSNSSASDLKKCVESLLIDSDEEQKNVRKLNNLRSDFAVLRKMHPQMRNQQKLQLFLRDNQFKMRVQQKMGIKIEQRMPIIKMYLVSTKFKMAVEEQLDEGDILSVLSRFGCVQYIHFGKTFAYIVYQNICSSFIAVKVLNQFHVNEKVRLRMIFCSVEESVFAQTNFHVYQNQRGRLETHQNYAGIAYQKNNEFVNKLIAKYEFGIENLPEFNIAQRIIGPKGSYMKLIIERVLSTHPLAHNYNINNIDSVFKMRMRGRCSGFMQSGQESEQKLHLFISSKEKWMFDAACQQVQHLLTKVFQDYKVSYQKNFRRHAIGLAYRLFYNEGNNFQEVKKVDLSEIEETVNLLALQNQVKLPQKVIEQKIMQREQARKQGKFDIADQIRNWLKCQGVIIMDSKGKKGKTSWKYILP